jgi:hypothetical protein
MRQENKILLEQIRLDARISLSPESWTGSESSMEMDRSSGTELSRLSLLRASCERVHGPTDLDDSPKGTAKDRLLASASRRLRLQTSPVESTDARWTRLARLNPDLQDESFQPEPESALPGWSLGSGVCSLPEDEEHAFEEELGGGQQHDERSPVSPRLSDISNNLPNWRISEVRASHMRTCMHTFYIA